MKLRSLYRMGITGVAYRGWQEISKSLERMGATVANANGHAPVLPDLKGHSALKKAAPRAGTADLDGAAKALLAHFRSAGTARFFEGAASEQVPVFLTAQMSRGRSHAISAADTVCQGRFDVLGYYRLFFGSPVDWHLDPNSGKRSPLVHWSRIDPLDAEEVGDSKVIWELNRHQWFIDLGQAFQFTGDERYAEAFALRVQEWMERNPPGMGINWASSLELSFRVISWCWALFLFRSAKTLSSGLFVQILKWIRLQAAHVERYLSYYYSPNTHLTGEALGLFYVGAVFPEFSESPRWRQLGAKILLEQADRQILPDGVYFEQSTCYQRYTVEIYLHFLILAARTGVPIPPTAGEKVQRMLDVLLSLARPDGSMPQIGDADGGLLVPLAHRPPDDFRGVFSTAAAFFGRADYAWAAGELAPETLWFLGMEGWKAFTALRPKPPSEHRLQVYPEGGYAVMRSGWGKRAHQLIFDAGPLGCPVSGGHGHADLLSIQCSVFGEPFLIDPGTYSYTADSAWRDYFRSTAAHSTITVDQRGQAVPAGPFAWEKRPRARLRKWMSTDDYELADADHDAYAGLPDPVMHRRRVIFVERRYWVVVDDLDGKESHRIDLRFQFAPIDVAVSPDGWCRVRGAEGRGLLLRPFARIPLPAALHEGEFHPLQGWASPDYGRRRSAPVLVYSAVTVLPLRVVTLLLPVEGHGVSPPAVDVLETRDPEGLILDSRETIRFDERNVFVGRR